MDKPQSRLDQVRKLQDQKQLELAALVEEESRLAAESQWRRSAEYKRLTAQLEEVKDHLHWKVRVPLKRRVWSLGFVSKKLEALRADIARLQAEEKAKAAEAVRLEQEIGKLRQKFLARPPK